MDIITDNVEDENKVPSVLYKYFPPTFGDTQIPYFDFDHSIRMTQPAGLNDVYECLPSFVNLDFSDFLIPDEELQKLMDEKLQNKFIEVNGVGPTREYREKFMENFVKERRRELQENSYNEEVSLVESFTGFFNDDIGLLSFSERWESAAMWGYYSADSSGFALGFWTSHPSILPLPMLKVNYTQQRCEFEADKMNPKDIASHKHIMKIIQTKNEDWAHEKEWRLVGHISTLKKLTNSTDQKNLEILGLEFPLEALAEVVLGINIDAEIESRILDILPDNIHVYKARLNLRGFDMDRALLER